MDPDEERLEAELTAAGVAGGADERWRTDE